MEDLATITARVERILRGEYEVPAILAGSLPGWYGAEHPYDAWARMLQHNTPPQNAAFYEAGTIGWASRE